MKTYSLSLLASLIALCGFSQQTISSSITHDDQEREYILYVPASYDAESAVPLILNYHGYTSNANDQMEYGDFRTIADTAGFLVVHPQGTLLNGIPHWNVGGWTTASTTDDVGFTEALIDALSSQYHIDANRIYATGMSNGGFMSFLLACQLSDRIAAIASVTGSMTPETYSDCLPQHPTPVLQIHGTTDPVVPYLGTSWTRSISTVLDYWKAYNNCAEEAVSINVPNTSIIDASTAKHIIYGEGDNTSTVEHFRISGGGHTWPGSFIPSPGTNHDIDASLEIWQFFSRYDLNSLGGTSAVNNQPIDKDQIRIFPNPNRGLLTVESQHTVGAPYQIHSIQGQLVKRGVFRQERENLNLSSIPNGLYILSVDGKGFKIMKHTTEH